MKRSTKNDFLRLAVVSVAVVAVVSAAAYYVYVEHYLAQTPYDSVGVPVQSQVESELVRLADLASERNLKVEDLSALGSMVEGNEAAHHEFEELETLVRYGEYEHAVHTIAFLDSTFRKGSHGLCPEHLIAHYYVFSKHGEVDLATDSLNDAKDQIHDWEGPARDFNDRYPSGRTFDEILENLEGHIAAIEAGTASPTDEEILSLANRAICVEGGFDHGETSYQDRHADDVGENDAEDAAAHE